MRWVLAGDCLVSSSDILSGVFGSQSPGTQPSISCRIVLKHDGRELTREVE